MLKRQVLYHVSLKVLLSLLLLLVLMHWVEDKIEKLWSCLSQPWRKPWDQTLRCSLSIPEEYVKRLAASQGIDTFNLVKGMEEIQAEQQRNMQQAATDGND